MIWLRAVLLTGFILCALFATMIYAVTSLLPLRSEVIAYISLAHGHQIFMRDMGTALDIQLNTGIASYLAWSPDGTQLAYVQYSNICVLDMPSRNSRCLTANGNTGSDLSPAWSPDGTRIAFTTTRNSTRDIYIMNADGSDQRRLTWSPYEEFNASWSPDGDYIAYISEAEGQAMVNIMQADGSGGRRITPLSTAAGLTLWEYWPRWSPDGRWIAYIAVTDYNPPTYHLCLIPPFDQQAEIIETASITIAPDWSMAWSPDSTRIASIALDDNRYKIAVVNITTGELTRISPHSADEAFPAWRP